jgi:hypothetical protein
VTSLDNKWQDSLYAILKIIIDLLPPLPKGNNSKLKYTTFAPLYLPVCVSIRSRL